MLFILPLRKKKSIKTKHKHIYTNQTRTRINFVGLKNKKLLPSTGQIEKKRSKISTRKLRFCFLTAISILYFVVFVPEIWEQSTKWMDLCPSTNEWIMKMRYIHTIDYYSALKREEIPLCETIWRNLEDIILSEISQWQRDRYWMIPLTSGF